jgi:hypothetical protein
LCDGVQVKTPKHETVEQCFCEFQRMVINIANWKGHLVVEGTGIDKPATTEGTKLQIPETSKPR